jgi:hypothetical protein
VSEIISSRMSGISVCIEIKVCQPIIKYKKDTMKQQLSAVHAAFSNPSPSDELFILANSKMHHSNSHLVIIGLFHTFSNSLRRV